MSEEPMNQPTILPRDQLASFRAAHAFTREARAHFSAFSDEVVASFVELPGGIAMAVFAPYYEDASRKGLRMVTVHEKADPENPGLVRIELMAEVVQPRDPRTPYTSRTGSSIEDLPDFKFDYNKPETWREVDVWVATAWNIMGEPTSARFVRPMRVGKYQSAKGHELWTATGEKPELSKP